MDLVIDANILFAALIRRNINYNLIFLDDITLYAPEFIFAEIEKHKEEILRKSEQNEENFLKLVSILKRYIKFVPLNELKNFIKKAEEISPDTADTSYIALALKLNIPIWSNDKDLKEKQNIIKVYSTEELIKMG